MEILKLMTLFIYAGLRTYVNLHGDIKSGQNPTIPNFIFSFISLNVVKYFSMEAPISQYIPAIIIRAKIEILLSLLILQAEICRLQLQAHSENRI